MSVYRSKMHPAMRLLALPIGFLGMVLFLLNAPAKAQSSNYCNTNAGFTPEAHNSNDGQRFEDFSIPVDQFTRFSVNSPQVVNGSSWISGVFVQLQSSDSLNHHYRLYYSLTENTGDCRIGRIRVTWLHVKFGGTDTYCFNYDIGQTSSQAMALTPSSKAYGFGSDTDEVVLSNDCIGGTQYTTTFNTPWLGPRSQFLSPYNGIPYQISSNPRSKRRGSFTVTNAADSTESATFTCTQDRNPNYLHFSDTPGLFRPGTGEYFLRNTSSFGNVDLQFNYGGVNEQYAFVGDWNGDGINTPGVFRDGNFLLRNSNSTGFPDISLYFGITGDIPLVGDWNGDGIDTIGVYRPSTGVVYLRNSNTTGGAEIQFAYGSAGDIPIAGDWDGNGFDSIGVYRPSTGQFFLRNSNTQGVADLAFSIGTISGGAPVAGDWDGDGIDSVGIYKDQTFYLRNLNTTGVADIAFLFGAPGDRPLVGEWNGQ